jgi:hypothetical protein
MPKKKAKLSPDTVVKNYWSDNAQFADLFNAVLFAGEQIIQPEELEEVDTEESTVLEYREYAESIHASRDNVKIHKRSKKSGIQFVMFGLESQEHVHYAMPLRVMGYDYISYKKQYDSNAQKYQKGNALSGDEFLSHMKKNDRFVPVITLVLYYGETPWDAAVSLHGILDIPEDLKPYVNDYQMLLVEARKNDLILHNLNNKDLFELLHILFDRKLSQKEAKENAIRYGLDHHTDKSVIMTVAGITNSRIDYSRFEKGEKNMISLFEDLAEESRAEGRAEGKICTIISLTRKKIAKNIPVESCADMLEEDPALITRIYSTIQAHPDWDDSQVHKELFPEG